MSALVTPRGVRRSPWCQCQHHAREHAGKGQCRALSLRANGQRTLCRCERFQPVAMANELVPS